jgi:lactate racemase
LKLNISYKRGTVPLELDENRVIKIVEPNSVPLIDEAEVIKQGLENSYGKNTFHSFLNNCEKFLIIVNDGTRPTPTARVLKYIHSELDTRDVQFIIATGVHRAPTDEEFRFIFGDLYDLYREKIWSHDARNDEMSNLGVSSNGTEMHINKLVTEYDNVMIIGSVEPHYFAGFTGGRKSFLPGVSSYKTIEMNHKHALKSEARALKLEGNPVHEDMIDALKTLSCEVFSIQAVLDKNHKICGLTSGDINESFFKAIDKAEEIFVAEIPGKADIVVSVAGYPMDVDLYQSQKALDNGKLALKDGGILIMVSSCREDLGEESFYELLSSCDTPAEVLEKIKDNYVLGYHKAGKMAEVNLWADVRACSELPNELWEKIFIKPVKDLQKAVDDALKEKGPEAGIIVLTDGCMTVPNIKIPEHTSASSANRI